MNSAAILVTVLAATTPAMGEVIVASTSDTSRGTPSERAQNTATLRRTIDDTIGSRLSSANAHVDATIVSLVVRSRRNAIVVSARVRLAISDNHGRILSIVVGGAKVERSARTYRAARDLRGLRDDAISAAVDGSFDKVRVAVDATAPRTPVRVAIGAR
jgi:hypothetical protein